MDTSKLTTVNYTPVTPPTPKPLPTNEVKILAHLEMAKHNTNHILHLILTLLSVGFWSFFWFCITASNTSQRNAIRRKAGLPTEPNTPAILMACVGILALVAIYGPK
jgi:hypothetical protein